MNSENAEEQFSPQESLAMIQKMIETAKNQFSENGHLYLVWGWVVLICSVAQFIMLSIFHYQNHYMVWMLTWLAFIYQAFYLIKEKRKERIKTYTDKIIGFVWIVFVIMMLLFAVLFGNAFGNDYYKMMSPIFLALYGMPTFLSGIILRFKPLIIGGIGCWLLSIAALYTPFDYQLLLLSAAMIIAWIIPGYMLRAKYKKANN
jgi:hypothetical protein